jgi:tetratricopeptide (TPR) repeat protein
MDQEQELLRIEALIDLGRLDEAWRLLAALPADDPTALRLRALCDYLLGNGPAALETAERAIAAEPENEWGHRLRASSLLLLGQPDAALPTFLFGWLVLVAFLLGATYLPTGSPLLVDVLAVGALVGIAFGLLVLTAIAIVAAMIWLWRLLRG